TIPYLYQLKNLLFWDLGMPLALAAFAGVVAALWWNARRHFRPDRVVLLLWVIPYFLFVGKFFAKFSRYMLPIVPIMTLLGAALLVWLVQRGSRGRRILGSAALMAVVVLSFLYSLAYMNIYEHPNTRVAASQWIFAHIPRGSTLVDEGYWDDVLPLPHNGQGCGTYYVCPGLNLYDPDTAQKVSTIASMLSQNHWLVMSSERMVGSIPKLPDRYPITVRYYRLLFAGRLGYQLVHVFQQHPQLGPIVVHDYGADESFHVYDHPIVRIFRRVRPMPAAQITRLLTAGTALASGTPAPQVDTRLMLSPSQWRADQRSATLDQMFPPRGFAMGHPIAVWLLLLELLGLLAFPLCFIVFRNLTDRGYVIAKTIGLVVLGYAVWILVSAGIAPYDRTIIEVVLLGLAILSALAGCRERRAIVAFVRLEWRVLLAGEAVFLAGFALFILLRLWYPDLGHQFSPVSITNAGDGRMGEKQMELAFLNAIVRSRVFPPYDPFFAHGYINYYYYGFFLVGTLCKLAQIVPATGFNLAIATFFAMLVGNSFSVGLSLTKRIGPGVVAAGAVGLIGNLAGAWQVVQALMAVGAVHSSVALIGGFIDALSGVWQVVTAHAVLPAFDFWAPTRIVPPGGVISEFPFFTYLFADLHPHLMAFPMTVAALALGLNYVPAGRSSGRRIALSVVLGAVLLGAIAATNPWDFPTYLVILAIGAVIGGFMLRRKLTLSALTVPLLQVAGIAALSALLYLPFKQGYQTVFTTGIGLVRDITPQMLESTGVCPSAAHVCSQQLRDAIVTPLGIYLEQFGALLFPIVSYLLVLLLAEAGAAKRLQRFLTVARFALYYRESLPLAWRAMRAVRRGRPRPAPVVDGSVLLGIAILVVGLAILGFSLLSFLVAVLGLNILVFMRLWRRLPAAQIFVLALIPVPLLLSIGTQIFFVKDFLSGGSMFRMNTIFKFYNQVWILYAISAGAALYYFAVSVLASPGAVLRTPHQPATRTLHKLPTEVQFSISGRSTPVPALPASFGFAGASPIPSEVKAFEEEPLGKAPQAPVAWWDRPMALFEHLPIWSAALVMLIAASLVYTCAGTVARETYRESWLPERSVPLTLDGMAFM
ncbi:MAG: DUF2298 domain-containing protein, partial [Chloroflexota bacterium]|nr:DUF2298 domain-containing protein [Chloroflexota bacterium]